RHEARLLGLAGIGSSTISRTRSGICVAPSYIHDRGSNKANAFGPASRLELHRSEDLLERRHVRGWRILVLHRHEDHDLALGLDHKDSRRVTGVDRPAAAFVGAR